MLGYLIFNYRIKVYLALNTEQEQCQNLISNREDELSENVKYKKGHDDHKCGGKRMKR